MIIDVQSHVFPREYGDFLVEHARSFRARREGSDFLFDFDGALKLSMPEEHYKPSSVISAMDMAGVEISIITCNIPDPGLLPPEHVPDGCRLANDIVKDIVEENSGRFAGLAFIPWQQPAKAADELERAAANGFKGVMLFSQNGGVYADDKSLAPVFELCAELSMPVVIHPSLPLWYKDAGAYGLVATAGFVMDTSLALLRMINSGIFDRVVNLKVVMPHAGGVLPYLDGRLNKNRKHVEPGAKDASKGRVIDCLKNGNIWYDLANASEAVLSFALCYFSRDKLLFGSDYPFIEPKLLVEMIENIIPAGADREKILYMNAAKLFKL